jgi:hypothetical protein
MDIFTTVLTRVVPVPIKPADLKVKALTKGAAANAVSDDIAGLEEQPSYHTKVAKEKSPDKEDNANDSSKEAVEPSTVPTDNTGQHIDIFDDSESTPEEQDDKPHLDIYI